MRYNFMLAEEGKREDFNSSCMVVQQKLDGQRAMWDGRGGNLWTRRKIDAGHKFPIIADELKKLGNVVIDGEIVAFDNDGNDSFSLLQRVAHLEDLVKIAELNDELNIVYVVFDIIEKNGKYLGRLPYIERHKILDEIVSGLNYVGALPYSDDFDEVWEVSEEGVILKRKDSIYKGYRCSDWIKVKKWKEEIIGFDDYEDHVDGMGITLKNIKGDRVSVGSHEVSKHIKEKGMPVKIEVKYFSKTEDGRMRFPVFRRIIAEGD